MFGDVVVGLWGFEERKYSLVLDNARLNLVESHKGFNAYFHVRLYRICRIPLLIYLVLYKLCWLAGDVA